MGHGAYNLNVAGTDHGRPGPERWSYSACIKTTWGRDEAWGGGRKWGVCVCVYIKGPKCRFPGPTLRAFDSIGL